MNKMGRQINYYMSDPCQQDFYTYLIDNGYVLSDLQGRELEKDTTAGLFLITRPSYKSIFMLDGSIDRLESSVIECSRTKVLIDKKRIARGRIWFCNNKNTIPSDELTSINKDVDRICRWIKNNVPRHVFWEDSFQRSELISKELWPLTDDYILL